LKRKEGLLFQTENRHNESDMIDAHAHVHDAAFDGDRDLVVERAQSAGVEALITIGTDIFESRQAVACAERYSAVWASVGIHPHTFDGIEDEGVLSESIAELKGIIESSRKVVAIGECGLDYFSPDDTGAVISERRKNMQKSGFLAQVSLARELSFPVIVHTRPSFGSMDAYEDVFDNCSKAVDWIIIPTDHNWYKEYLVALKVRDTLKAMKLEYPKLVTAEK